LPAQRGLKAQVVREQLRRLAGIERDVVVEPVPGDVDGLRWRTRVHYAVDGSGRPGLRRHRSHDIEPVDRCHIATDAVHALGVTARRWPGTASVQAVAPSIGERLVIATPPGPGPDAEVHERAAGRTWRVRGSGFWQVHPGAADALVAAVLDGLEPRPGERALDLYAGVGLFAGALAPRLGASGSVTAVEGSGRAAADAEVNLADERTVRVERGPVDRVLERLGSGRVDLVVLDPPRDGAGRRVVEAIAARTPRAVAYVACDPAALARDLAWFAELGYRLASLRAFDLFPMTHHVECVAVVVREGAEAAVLR
jgi:tRNA/tmRNA/rRNA uracil-C5-methylase (TrmA/RlmC/RlmD family)